MLNKYLKIALLTILFCLALSLQPVFAGESCCVCNPLKNKDNQTASGAPTEGKCDQYIIYSTPTCHGQYCPPQGQPTNECRILESSCANVSKAILEKINGQNSKQPLPIEAPNLQIAIPGLTLTQPISAKEMPNTGRLFYSIPWIGEYIGAIYRFGVSAASILAIVMIIIGGFIWLTSAGNPTKITQAKSYISGALLGLMLALGSYTILRLVNPSLVNLSSIKILMIEYEQMEQGGHESDYFQVNSGAKGAVSAYDSAPCPTNAEATNGFQAFITAYYSPPPGEKGFYNSFECNVAMQCSCTRDSSKTCSHKYGPGCLFKKPVEQLIPNIDYCTKTASGSPPTSWVTVAADVKKGTGKGWADHKECWSFGDTFEIYDSGGNKVGNTWVIGDQGSAIKSRHFDLYVGTDLSKARSLGGVYTIKFTKCTKCPLR
ncbi:MAG: hypothetical protein WC480_02065 [Patescibacteria group bacterium]